MSIMEVLTLLAILLSPIIAVGVTLWYESRKEHRTAMQQLFFALMASRESNPPTIEWVNALNLIDVVFSSKPIVVRLSHEYSDLLTTGAQNIELQNRKYLDLLMEMADTLGYRTLKERDFDRFFNPASLADQKQIDADLRKELLRVLQNTDSLRVSAKK